MSVAFCISGHGLGHASRQAEVVNSLGRLCPTLPISIYTQASRWFLDQTLTVEASIEPYACDTGAIQHDSLDIDIPATLAAAMAFEADADTAAADLATRWRDAGVSVVVCDVPPMACSAARLAGLPAIALANFTWDWIYEDFTGDHPGYDQLPGLLRSRYAGAHAAWRLPMAGGFEGFSTVLDMPWVARRSRRAPTDTRHLLGADDDRPLVLVSFGGYGVAGWNLSSHAGAPYRLVLAGGSAHAPVHAPDDALVLPLGALATMGLRYEDLVAACDVVVSKPGYGIVSECVANGTALLYTDRGRFREYAVMVEAMPRVLRARHIPRLRLSQARWDEDIAALLAQPDPPERPLVNGAEVAAGMISAMV